MESGLKERWDDACGKNSLGEGSKLGLSDSRNSNKGTLKLCHEE